MISPVCPATRARWQSGLSRLPPQIETLKESMARAMAVKAMVTGSKGSGSPGVTGSRLAAIDVRRLGSADFALVLDLDGGVLDIDPFQRLAGGALGLDGLGLGCLARDH